VTTLHEGNLAMQQAVLRAAGDALTFPVREEVLLSETEFRTTAAKLRDAHVDAIAVLLHPAHSGIFARVLRQSGVLLPLFALGNFEDLGVRKSAAGTLDGQ